MLFRLLTSIFIISVAQAARADNSNPHEYQLTLTWPKQTQASVFDGQVTGLAATADGGLWVSATVRNKFATNQHFNATGEFLNKFSANLRALSVAADGSIWGIGESADLDLGAPFIQHYSPKGKLLKTFGGYRSHYVRSDIAHTSDGSIWAIYNHQALHYSVEGELLHKIDVYQDGLTHQLLGLGIALDNSIWLTGTDGIMHYQADGKLLTKFMPPSKTPANDIVVARDGTLWTIAGATFWHLNIDGTLIDKFGRDSNAFSDSYPIEFRSLAVTQDGSLWSTTPQQVFQLTPQHQIRQHSSGGIQPTRVIAAPDGSVWTLDGNNQKLWHVSASGQVLQQLGPIAECTPNKRFSTIGRYQRTFALAPDGSLWLVDAYVSSNYELAGYPTTNIETCLQHIDVNGNLLYKRNNPAYNTLQASSSDAFLLAVAADGSLWLANPLTDTIEHLTSDGSALRGIYSGMRNLSGITLAADGSIWLCHQNALVQHLSATGEILTQFTATTAAQTTTQPNAIALARDGSLWLADSKNNRILHFSNTGEYIEQINPPDNYNSRYMAQGASFDIAVDNQDQIWLASAQLDPATNTSQASLQRYSLTSQLSPVAEYLPAYQWLTVRTIAVDGAYYQATFNQYYQDTFNELGLLQTKKALIVQLLSLSPAKQRYSPEARYDTQTKLLTIPEVHVGEERYQAVLQPAGGYYGDFWFELQSVTPVAK